MKVRTDFVTNSSSSSFVLSFKSDTDMKSALERFRNKYGDIYYDALAEEILSSKWTKSMVLKEIKHYLLK